MKTKKLFLLLASMLLLVMMAVTASASIEYAVDLPDGYSSSSTAYPVVYVLPKDGYAKDNSGITTKLLAAIDAGKGMDMIIVRPTFAKGDDLKNEMTWLVNEIDAKYRTTKNAAHRAVIGTDAGGYLAYVLGALGANDFGFMASINGNLVNNDWYSTYGDLYSQITKSTITGKFAYLDAPVDGVWTNQKGSSNDMANKFIGFGMQPSEIEPTIRHLKDGETLEDFMTESVNRVADRFTNFVFSGAAKGSVSLEKAVMLASEGNAKVSYTVNTTSVLNTYVSGDVDMQIIVSVVDPKTGDVLAEKVADTVKVSGPATFNGTASVPNKVNGDSSNVVLSVNVLSTDIELATATLIRGKAPTKTAIDLMGDWYFKYTKYSTLDMSTLSESEYKTWHVVQPALTSWAAGFGNINQSTVGMPEGHPYFGYLIIGNGYYVKEFTVPADFATENVTLSVGRIDDRCDVYINGKRAGGMGIDENGKSTGESVWAEYTAIPIDASLLNYGGKNVIMVRDVNDGIGGGGWYQGPVGLYAGEAFDAINPEAYDPHFYEETFESKYAAGMLGEASPYDNPYLIYLPEDYYETDRHYPTVYLMHQYNSTHTSYKTDAVNELFKEGVKEGMFDEFIVVIPNSQESSWWRGDWLKMITEELIPHIDANYRTIDDARYRFTAGCSMGGQGAFGVALQNPDYFSGAISFFGAFSMGGNASPNTIAAKESAEYLDNFAMYFICGNQDIYQFGQPAIELNQQLEALGADHYFFIENGEHNSAFYIPNFKDAFEYTWSKMYDETFEDANKPNLKTMAYANFDKSANGATLIFAANEKIEKYFNQIPASSYTQNETPALSIPLRITVTQNGQKYQLVIRDHKLAQGSNVNVFDGLTGADFTPISKAAGELDLSKRYDCKIEGAIFDEEWVELGRIPKDLLNSLNLPNTGDNSNIVLCGLLLAASVAMIAVLGKKKAHA